MDGRSLQVASAGGSLSRCTAPVGQPGEQRSRLAPRAHGMLERACARAQAAQHPTRTSSAGSTQRPRLCCGHRLRKGTRLSKLAAYLNHAGTSYPKPPAVLRAVSAALEEAPDAYPALFASARRSVAAHLGVSEASRLLFTSSCTHALDVAVSELPWEPGDAVISSHLEHNALLRPIARLARRGVDHERSPYVPGHPFDLEWLKRRLESGRVRLVALSGASNVTGEVLPLSEVVQLAHAQGARVLVDAAQLFGLVPTSVTKLGCDLLVFAGHKGPLGPQGIGGLWASPEVAFESESPACEVERPGPGPADRSLAMPGYCDVGSVNLAGLAGLAAGLSAFGPSRESKGAQARALAAALAKAARAIPGMEVFGHAGAPQTATVSIRHHRLSLGEAEALLAARGVRVRAGLHCAPEALTAIGAPAGTVRCSFGATSTPEDLAQGVDALRAVCQ